jgi:hypothetical protein
MPGQGWCCKIVDLLPYVLLAVWKQDAPSLISVHVLRKGTGCPLLTKQAAKGKLILLSQLHV